jgi:hypothetical protein
MKKFITVLNTNISIVVLPLLIILMSEGCKKNNDTANTTTNVSTSTYLGTGSVSQGVGTTTITNLFPAGIRVAALGTVTSTDSKTWTVPADLNFTNSAFPFASDLYNSYVAGHSYATVALALSALSGSDIVTIDPTGDVYTAYIFADNYFEMYVNGIPVGKDAVPYTEFNSSIIRFKAIKPFTIAVKCVDYEERLGIGTEFNSGDPYHIGDGGFVAVLKNVSGNTVAITDNTWKAQTFYTAPVADLSCLTESGTSRLSGNCPSSSGSATSYGVHWAVPATWFTTSYDDSAWPAATLFTNAIVGVDNKPSYTNFTSIFDDTTNDASFIWSTNLKLDNLILFRKKIQ